MAFFLPGVSAPTLSLSVVKIALKIKTKNNVLYVLACVANISLLSTFPPRTPSILAQGICLSTQYPIRIGRYPLPKGFFVVISNRFITREQLGVVTSCVRDDDPIEGITGPGSVDRMIDDGHEPVIIRNSQTDHLR